MFPAASETPQQTPSDNEQECTQSDTYLYTHTHTHARMTYMYIKMLVPPNMSSGHSINYCHCRSEQKTQTQTECTTEATVMNVGHCTVRTFKDASATRQAFSINKL